MPAPPQAAATLSQVQAHLHPTVQGPKLWAFRLALLLVIPFLALCCLELGLRLAGFGYPTSFFLRQQIGGRGVLVENDKFGWRFFGPARARTPRPMEVPLVKPPGTCRIFVFGESAAYGDPKPEYGLPRFLEVLLRARFPGVNFEVINAAMTGINSNVILPIARDCAKHEGDIWVIYMGNNEVVGPFGSGTVFGRQTPGLAVIRGDILLKSTRIGELLDQFLSGRRNRPGPEREWEGMAMFLNSQVAEDDPRMAAVYSHFQRNLTDIIHVGRAHGAQIVVSTVVSNLKDCAPFASQHRPDLDSARRTQWDELYQAGVKAVETGRFAEALESFRQAAALDDRYAELHFRWAQCCLRLGEDEPAREHFLQARDYDTLRFRADSRLNQIIRNVAASQAGQGTRLADSQTELARQSPHGVPGHELLYEHVHLNFEGNYALALAVGEQILKALPAPVKAREAPGNHWLSVDECARHLAWTSWDQYRTWQSVLWRLNEPPFTTQCDHAEACQRLRQDLERLLPEQKTSGLRRAAGQYQEAVALAPEDWVLERNRVELFRRLKDLAGAERAARRAIELLPHDWMGHLELGLLLLQAHRPEEARAEFEQVLDKDPGSVPALNALALALRELGRTAEAMDTLERALRFKPDSADTHLNLGTTFESLNRKEDARRQFRLALQDRLDTPELLVRAGKICMLQGWVDEAITNFDRALSLNPTDAPLEWYLGGALDTKGRTAEALGHFAQSVRLDPDLAGGHLGLGIELSRQGKNREAVDEFSTALRLDPALPDARLRLGIALMRQQKLQEARAQFERVLVEQPGNATAQKYLLMIVKAQSSPAQAGGSALPDPHPAGPGGGQL